MKKFKFLSVVAFVGLICLVGCRSKQTIGSSYSYYDFKSTLISASPSGYITMRSWGSGPDKSSAVKEAKKNAVNDVLFKGFDISNNHMARPLIHEVNARERYAEYFDRFFSDGGEYEKFVEETSSSDGSRIESKSPGRQNYGIIVTIDRNALQNQMRADGLINN